LTLDLFSKSCAMTSFGIRNLADADAIAQELEDTREIGVIDAGLMDWSSPPSRKDWKNP
jgi:hypothetical protein